jgi:hypothetical protein
MADYESRLEKLEQRATSSDTQNMIVVLVYPGEDRTAKVAEARREHGLGEGDSRRMIVVIFSGAGDGADGLPASVPRG